jgi:uncharacterized protein
MLLQKATLNLITLCSGYQQAMPPVSLLCYSLAAFESLHLEARVMSKEKLTPFVNQKYLNLETFKRDGTGVRTPLWFAEQDGRIYIYTLANAWKVKRVRNNPRVRIAPCDIRGKLTGDWVEARARIVEGSEAQLGHQLLDKKYGLMKKIGTWFSRLRKRQHAVIGIQV